MRKNLVKGVAILLVLLMLMSCSNKNITNTPDETPNENDNSDVSDNTPNEDENPVEVVYEISDEITSKELINSSMNYLLSKKDDDSAFEVMETKVTIDVTENGIVKDSIDSAKTNTTKLNSLIEKASEGTKLYFPHGTYFFSIDSKGNSIQIINKRNLTILGEDATFINTSYDAKNGMNTKYYSLSRFIIMYRSEKIVIDGITFDYYNHTCADGVISKIEDGYTYINVYDEFMEGEKPALSGGEYVFCVNLFESNLTPKDEYYINPKGYLLELVDASEHLFRLQGSYGAKDDIVSFRFTSGSYASPCIVLQENDGVTIRNCTQRTCPSATIYAPSYNSNFLFENLRVEVYPGSEQLFASNEDCIHIKGLTGKLVVRNCHFIGIGDDALNVHSKIGQVSSFEENTITLKEKVTNWGKAGDIVEFYTKTYTLLGKSKLVSIDSSGTKMTVESIPEGVDSETLLLNKNNNPITIISGCEVKRSRARGFLIQTKNCLISDCSFKDIRLPAILISPDLDYWYEGGASDNVLITNCTFDHVATGSNMANLGVIYINGCHDLKKYPTTRTAIHKNITVQNCTFTNLSNVYVIYANSVANIKNDSIVTDDSELGILKR